MDKLKWSNKKPKITKECILLVANKYKWGWEYALYQMKKITFDDKWYYGIIDQDGDEWGEYDEIAAEKYAIIEQIKWNYKKQK